MKTKTDDILPLFIIVVNFLSMSITLLSFILGWQWFLSGIFGNLTTPQCIGIFILYKIMSVPYFHYVEDIECRFFNSLGKLLAVFILFFVMTVIHFIMV